MKDKTTAGLLALFLGGVGVHRFYLGQTVIGLLYLVFFWTWIPAFIAFFEALGFFFMSEASFNAKYNGGATVAALPSPQNIVVNVANNNTASGGGGKLSENLRELLRLKDSGLLTDEEFAQQKRRVLEAG